MEIGEKYQHNIDDSQIIIVAFEDWLPYWNSTEKEQCAKVKVIKKDKWNDMKIGVCFHISVKSLERRYKIIYNITNV